MKKFKTILVGLGKIGFYYDIKKQKSNLTHIKSLKKIKKIDVVCGVDINKKKIFDFKKNYNIDVSTNLALALKKYQPEFVVVSVNTASLYKILIIISKFKSVKKVLVEKPGVENFDQIKQILKIYLKSKIKLYVNYNRSYQQKILNIFSLLKKNNFKIVYFYNRGILNNCSHLLNLIFLYQDLPYKIKILDKGKKFDKDLQPDLELKFKKGTIYLLKNQNNSIVHNELTFLTGNYKINSDSKFNQFTKFKLVKDKYIKRYKSYKIAKKIIIDEQKYQLNVYEKVLNNNLDKLNLNILKSSVKVLSLINKIKNNI